MTVHVPMRVVFQTVMTVHVPMRVVFLMVTTLHVQIVRMSQMAILY
jgi:hypothetical protein